MLKAITLGLMSFGALTAAAFETPVEPLADASAFTQASPRKHSPLNAPEKAPSIPKGEWTNIGTGKWFDDLFSYYQVVAPGDMWEVVVEESAATPGWYRLLPYGPGSPVADYMGDDDTENYVYVNATNPDKVYIPDFDVFGKYKVSQHVDENSWWDETEYGKLENGVISFPADCFCHRVPEAGGPWVRINNSGKTRLALPGSNPEDYTFRVESPFCVDEEGNVRLRFTIGEDIATVKYVLLEGEYFAEGNNVNLIVTQGKDLKGTVLRATPRKRVMFSLLAVALGHGGEVVATSDCHFFGPDSADADTWVPAGDASFTESIFVPLYSNLTAETLIVPYEESVENPGRIRLVDPYSVHGFNPVVDHGHSHYIYIDAMANNAVYVEASPVGVDFGGGESAVWSWAGRYVEYGMASEAYNEGLFGTRSGNVITMPDNSLLVGEKGYAGGTFSTTGRGFRISLRPNSSGIGAVDAEAEADAPALYYRLDGTALTGEPSAAGIYIRRAAGRTEKIVIR